MTWCFWSAGVVNGSGCRELIDGTLAIVVAKVYRVE